MKLSNRVEEMQFSPIRKFNKLAISAEKEGKKVYHLNIGQPDIETPECFMEKVRGFDKKVVAYSESGGEKVLQRAISDYFKNYHIYFDEEDIIITNGGSEALTMIFTSILNPGDEVIIAEPFYTNYHTFVTAACGKIVPITTKAEDGYNFAKRELIESVITPKTRAICCISPGNPTGRVLSLDDMRVIGEIAKEHDLWIIADEVYREFVYDNREITSFGMIKDIQDRVIIVDSISKRFSACGARVGCVISKNKSFMEAVMKLAQGRLCAATLDQIGAAALYNLDKSYYEEIRSEYEGRRDVVYEELSKISGVICEKPGGSFYVTVKIPSICADDLLLYFLTEFQDNNETVMFAPAEGFYMTEGVGKDEFRIAYVLNKDDMRRGIELLKLGIDGYLNLKNSGENS